MQFTATRALAALGFVLLAATNVNAARPEAVINTGSLITPMWTPTGLNTQAVNVVVQLGGVPRPGDPAPAQRRDDEKCRDDHRDRR